MGQKVWVIGEEDWNGSTRKILVEPTTSEPAAAPAASRAESNRSPALAFSLALLVWGVGHYYAREYRRGTAFLAAMLTFATFIYLLACDPATLKLAVSGSGQGDAVLASCGLVLFLFGPALWLGNAVDAYALTARSNDKPFFGVNSEILPLLASFVVPGWGQFLNGQPKKGGFFLPFGAAGGAAAGILLGVRYVIPWFHTPFARQAVEWSVLTALVFLPVSLVGWVVGIFDSYRVSKELFRKRFSMKNVGFWAWAKHHLSDFLPSSTAILSLLLAISVGMQLLPRHYYLEQLDKLRLEMSALHLDSLAALARNIMDLLGR